MMKFLCMISLLGITYHTNTALSGGLFMERVMGIEPTYSAWEAAALPLCYTRI